MSASDGVVRSPRAAGQYTGYADLAPRGNGSETADLSITKTNGVSSVTAGLPTTYTITVANAGPATAPNARVVDELAPAVFTNVTWSCAASGATVSTAAGESAANESNNTATDVDLITELVDVSIAATGPATLVAGGPPGTYTLVVTNSGPSTAHRIPVSDRVFEDIGFGLDRSDLITGFTPPAGVPCTVRPYFDPIRRVTINLRVCEIPTLAPGETSTFTVQVTIPHDFAPGRIDSDGFIDEAAYGETDVDVDDYTSIVVTDIVAEADVAVAKDGPASAVAGSTVSFFLHVTNNGPSTATDIVLADPLPAGLVFVAADGPCPTLPCTIPSLAPGEGSSTRYIS